MCWNTVCFSRAAKVLSLVGAGAEGVVFPLNSKTRKDQANGCPVLSSLPLLCPPFLISTPGHVGMSVLGKMVPVWLSMAFLSLFLFLAKLPAQCQAAADPTVAPFNLPIVVETKEGDKQRSIWAVHVDPNDIEACECDHPFKLLYCVFVILLLVCAVHVDV